MKCSIYGNCVLTNTFLSVILQMTVAHPNLNSCHRDGELKQQKLTIQRKGRGKDFCEWGPFFSLATLFITPKTKWQGTQTVLHFFILHVNGKIANSCTKIMSIYMVDFFYLIMFYVLKVKIKRFSQWNASIRNVKNKETVSSKSIK